MKQIFVVIMTIAIITLTFASCANTNLRQNTINDKPVFKQDTPAEKEKLNKQNKNEKEKKEEKQKKEKNNKKKKDRLNKLMSDPRFIMDLTSGKIFENSNNWIYYSPDLIGD